MENNEVISARVSASNRSSAQLSTHAFKQGLNAQRRIETAKGEDPCIANPRCAG